MRRLVPPVADEFEELRSMNPTARREFARQAVGRQWRDDGWALRAALGAMVIVVAAPIVVGGTWSVRSGQVPASRLFWYVPLMVLSACAVGVDSNRKWQRRAIRSRIDEPRCYRCDFSLRGLETRDWRVRCPECGSEQVVVCAN